MFWQGKILLTLTRPQPSFPLPYSLLSLPRALRLAAQEAGPLAVHVGPIPLRGIVVFLRPPKQLGGATAAVRRARMPARAKILATASDAYKTPSCRRGDALAAPVLLLFFFPASSSKP